MPPDNLYTALSRKGKAKQRRSFTDEIPSLIDEERGRTDELLETAGGARSEYVDRLRGFDPMEYMKGAASATFRGLKGGFDAVNSRRQSALNARGLFGSNLGGAAQGRDFNSRLSTALAGQSLSAAGLESTNIGRFGDLYETDADRAERGRSQSIGLYGDQRDFETYLSNLQEERKRRKKKGLFGTLGSLVGAGAGFLLGGGPAGARIGGRLGGAALGSGIGSGIGDAF